MHELAMMLRRRRFERGSLELSMKEVKVDLDKDGRVSGAHVVENTESHQIIEEFMLAANEAVADTLREAGFRSCAACIRSRSAEAESLTEFVTELGFQTESLESRFELQKLLELDPRPAGGAGGELCGAAQLATGRLQSGEEGHYALASDCYCHFTSPIRRYPDLTIHRLVDALLAKKKPRATSAELVALGEHCSEREQRAEAAERELTKVKLLIT